MSLLRYVRVKKQHVDLRLLRSKSTIPHAPEEYDVVIVGGGPAGLALAGALASSSTRKMTRVALVEASDLSRVRNWDPKDEEFSNRVSSITTASRAFLEGMGAWSFVDQSRTTPITEMQVWDGISDSRINFHLTGSNVNEELARMTENLNLQRALLQHLDNYSDSVEVLDRTRVDAIRNDDREGGGGWPLVHTSDDRILRARLLVGADGINSPVRAFAGIDTYGWAYNTRAIVATLSHLPRPQSPWQSPNTVAYQRFLPTGPIAFLPLTSNTSSLVWSTKPALAAALESVDSTTLAHLINAAFRLPEASMRYLHSIILESHQSNTPPSPEAILGEIKWREESHFIDPHSALSSTNVEEMIGIPPEDAESYPPLVTSIQPRTVASFPLRLSHADVYIGEGEGARTALVGDAAHAVHPLAGQGLNMGLADAQSLSECIHEAIINGGDIGSRTALLPYPRSRYFENHKLLSVTDKLHKLYSSTSPAVVWTRSVGLDVVNELASVKDIIASPAGGPSGRSNGAAGWNLAATGIEGISNAVGIATDLASSLGNLAGSAIKTVLSSNKPT